MKEIKDMNLAELADFVDSQLIHIHYQKRDDDFYVAERLRELHEQTRWVSVEERLPTAEDTDEYGFVEVFWKDESNGDTRQHATLIDKKLMSHWRRINPPEDK